MTIESLKKEFNEKDSNKESIYNDIRTKVHHWKVSGYRLNILNEVITLFFILSIDN